VVKSNIHQAKSNLSRLIELAVAGEEVIISKAGKPVARLIPYTVRKKPRRLGILKGQVRISPDFDELPPALAPAFRGECE
jgi:prevent-host-death family protein